MIGLVVMAVLLVLGGVALALVGLRFRAAIRGFNARAVAAQGVVVGSRMHRMGSGIRREVFFPQLEIRTREGASVIVDGLGEHEPPAPGAVRPVLYDPADPREASFTGPRGQARLPETLIVLGGTLVISGIALAALVLTVLPRG